MTPAPVFRRAECSRICTDVNCKKLHGDVWEYRGTFYFAQEAARAVHARDEANNVRAD